MDGVVKKWGNSAAVRIPASVLAARTLSWIKPSMCAKSADAS